MEHIGTMIEKELHYGEMTTGTGQRQWRVVIVGSSSVDVCAFRD